MSMNARKNLSKKYQMGPNSRAAAGAIKFVSAGIIVAVVLFCEVMYLGVISSAFPNGIFRALATIGAIAGGMSVLALILGKMFWFPPGGQLIWGWMFTACEVVVLVLNLLLSFEIVWHTVDTWMATWRDFSPASPVIALIGWVVIWQLDSSTKARHAIIEQEQVELESELDYRGQVHVAVMDLKHSYLSQTVENLKYEFSSAEVQGALRQGARDLAGSVLSEFTNIPVAPRPDATQRLARTVGADPGSGARQDEERGLPAPQPYNRGDASESADSGQGGGILGALIDKAKDALGGRQDGGNAAEVEPEPPPARSRRERERIVVPVEASDVRHRRRDRERRVREAGRGTGNLDSQVGDLAATPEPAAPVEPQKKKKVKKLPGQ